MYSLWSVKDRSEDSIHSLSQQSTLAIFEILGMAPILLALQIALMVSASILILAILIIGITIGGIGFLAHYSITKLIGCIKQSCCSR